MPDFSPTTSLCGIKALLILDQDGKCILGKYYDKEVFPLEKDQTAFEKNLFQKTHKANSEIIQLDRLICVYRSNVDLFFYVIGSGQEDELILQSVLSYVYDATVLPKNVDQPGLSLLAAHRDQQQRRMKKRKAASEDKAQRRASKGRRIRYVELPKLVNFFPATPERTAWSYERRNELFKSLFAA